MSIYILCGIAYFFGQVLSAMEKIAQLKAKFQQLAPGVIIGTYFKEEWNTIIVSMLIMGLCQFALYIAIMNHRPGPEWFWQWGVYVLALVLGYAGQRIVYKYMKTTEKKLNSFNDKIANDEK